MKTKKGPGWLALTRRPGERIVISDDQGQQLIIRVDRVLRGQVQISFWAEQYFRIRREELITENSHGRPPLFPTGNA